MTGGNTHATVTKLIEAPTHYYSSHAARSRAVNEKIIKSTETIKKCDICDKKSIKALAKKIGHYVSLATSKTFMLIKKAGGIAPASLIWINRSKCAFIKVFESLKSVCCLISDRTEFIKKLKAAFLNGQKMASMAFSTAMAFIEKKGRENVLKVTAATGLFVVAVSIFAATCSVGYSVSIGDVNLGIVESKDMSSRLLAETQGEMFAASGTEFVPGGTLHVSPRITLKSRFATEDEFKEKLKSTSTDMIPAYAIVVDGKIIIGLPGKEMALSAIEEYKNAFSLDVENVKTEFNNDVSIEYRFIPKSLLRTKDAAVSHLLSGRFTLYKTVGGETVSDIAKKSGISESMIRRSNNIDGDVLPEGKVLKLCSGEMFVDVKAVKNVNREVAIPFETISKEDPNQLIGYAKVESGGQEGLKFIEESITYINGIETKRNVVKENILKNPTTELMVIGTKKPPSPIGTGHLSRPAGGSVSSRFGNRWGRKHTGVDLSADLGTPIYAADNGTVIYSEFNNGGYGNMVKIDHGNGIVTYYAHCDELKANKGQVVAKGDLIATVGNTGHSTGPHLHFEVLKDGAPIDPMPYLK